MIDQNKYYLNFKETDKLIEELNKPVFLKTELDVVYDDFVRWENNDLLWRDTDIRKNDQRRYSYVEYVWVKLIELLRGFGFEYDIIQSYIPMLKTKVDSEIIHKGLIERREEISNIYNQQTVDHFIRNKEEIDLSQIDITLFEMLLINAISYNDLVAILFFPNTYNFCFPVSGEVYKEMEKDSNSSTILRPYLESSHVSISISEITKKFVVKDIDSQKDYGRFQSILSKEEYNLLKVVRKNFKKIRSLKIRFQSGQMSMVEIKTIKKVALESRLLEHIKRGDYSTIQIESVDGKIVNFENTQKYKL